MYPTHIYVKLFVIYYCCEVQIRNYEYPVDIIHNWSFKMFFHHVWRSDLINVRSDFIPPFFILRLFVIRISLINILKTVIKPLITITIIHNLRIFHSISMMLLCHCKCSKCIIFLNVNDLQDLTAIQQQLLFLVCFEEFQITACDLWRK